MRSIVRVVVVVVGVVVVVPCIFSSCREIFLNFNLSEHGLTRYAEWILSSSRAIKHV